MTFEEYGKAFTFGNSMQMQPPRRRSADLHSKIDEMLRSTDPAWVDVIHLTIQSLHGQFCLERTRRSHSQIPIHSDLRSSSPDEEDKVPSGRSS